MRVFRDQLNREVVLHNVPQRIVSLVPSQTEFLHQIGANVVGQTIFCIHPKDKQRQTVRIGGTKKLKKEVISALKPDLIIGNKEENHSEDIAQLSQHVPVWVSDVHDVDSAIEMMHQMGALLDKEQQARMITEEIDRRWSRFPTLTEGQQKRVLYLIWRDPYMGVGGGTFIHDLLTRSGFDNVLGQKSRYPTLTNDMISHLDVDIVMLSSEPYPFKEKHITEMTRLAKGAKVVLVDGEMWSWYGNRMIIAADYIYQFREDIQNLMP
jgi:ABC-type Fe3+-hydroxamate transport system substrate-binding protein